MPPLDLTFASGESSLSVSRFSAHADQARTCSDATTAGSTLRTNRCPHWQTSTSGRAHSTRRWHLEHSSTSGRPCRSQ